MAQNTTQDNSLISSLQIRAARGLLGISALELAQAAGVPHRTVQRLETGTGIPDYRSGTLDRLKSALEREGIEFIGDPLTSPGVRLKRAKPNQP